MKTASATHELDKTFASFAKARKPHDVDWLLDCAAFVGKQYVEWHTPKNGEGRFRTIPRQSGEDPDSPRPLSNRIYHFIMDSYAQAKEHIPTLEVRPTNVDALSMSDAKVAEAWLAHVADPTQANWEARRNAALFWAVLVGEGWNKWIMDSDGRKVRIESCSPLEVYLPPNCESYLDATRIIHARAMDPDDVFEAYGRELPAEAVDGVDTTRATVLREIGMMSGTPTVTVKELWQLPGRRRPNGRFVTWAGGVILQDGDFPYKHGMLPFTQMVHSPVPGTPHGTSGTKVMRPQQMALNKYDSQRMISEDNFANFKWFYDSALDLSAKPDRSRNQVLTGDTNNGQVAAPAIIQAQVWPDSQNGNYIVEGMQDSVGLHDASQGAAPGRVDSAQGIEALKESDRGRLSELRSTGNIAVARGFGMLIELARQYIAEEQMVADYSRDGAPAVHRFKTSQFPKQPMLRVVEDDGLPKSKSARNAEVIARFSAGIYGDPTAESTRRFALSMLGGAAGGLVTPEQRDELEAWNENMQMLSGQYVSPHKWQNHELHRRVLDECRKTAEYQGATDRVQGLFAMHEEETTAVELEEIIDEAKRKAAIDEAVAAVQPPPPPPPPVDPAGMGPPPVDPANILPPTEPTGAPLA